MQVTTDLRPMFSYSLIPIIVIVFLLIVILVLMLIKHKKKKLVKNIDIIIPSKKDVNAIKRIYLLKIDNLSTDFNAKKINNRQAYQNLSSLIRNFIYETTNIKVQNYTLSDIEKINMPILFELVSEYYDPEFSQISKGSITASIEKTRKVIEKWN